MRNGSHIRAGFLYALGLIGILIVTACGGAGQERTPTPVSVASPVASPNQATTAVASPDAAGGAWGAASPTTVGASPTTVWPTATRRPATVVAPTRPVATKPPTIPPPSSPMPTATATAANGDLLVALSQDFISGDPAPYGVGTSDVGGSITVTNGQYTIALPAGYWQSSIAINPPLELADGVIVVDATFGGTGTAGVVARWVERDSGYNAYVCWLNSGGGAGCNLLLDSGWSDLFRVDPGTVAVLATNTLVVSVVGNQIEFAVNDMIVGSANDATLPSGNWGFYAESGQDAPFSAGFNTITVYQAPPGFTLGA